VGEDGWRVFFAFFATLIWISLVMLAVVAIVEVSIGVAVEAAAGDYVKSLSQAKMGEIARKAAQDVASNSGPTWKVRAEGMQAVLTAIGIAVAAGWALYVFFLGRSYIGVVNVLIEPKGLMRSGGRTGAVVSVTIRNVGRTRVGKRVARIRAAPLNKDQLELSMGQPSMMPASVPSTTAEIGTLLFSKHATELEEAIEALEPGQETTEEVVIILGDVQVARVEAVFIGEIRPLFLLKDRAFSSRIYLDMAALEATEANGTMEVSSRSEKTANEEEKEK
jgi:hypothetical protein